MWTEERLNKMLTTPSEALSGELGRLEGDILVLGAGGKMGPTLCVLAKNALRAAGVEKRVIAVSRFSDPLVVELLRENGVEMISADLLAPARWTACRTRRTSSTWRAKSSARTAMNTPPGR